MPTTETPPTGEWIVLLELPRRIKVNIAFRSWYDDWGRHVLERRILPGPNHAWGTNPTWLPENPTSMRTWLTFLNREDRDMEPADWQNFYIAQAHAARALNLI